MGWLSNILRGRQKTRPWDLRGEHRNQHCNSKECPKPAAGCLCVCKSCRGEWQKEMTAFQKALEENCGSFELARDVMNSGRPGEALNARSGPGTPEPGSMDW